MPSHVQKMPQAAADLVEIAAFIAEDNPEAAERFLDAAEAAFGMITSLPSLGWTFRFQSPAAQEMRVWRVEGFERYL